MKNSYSAQSRLLISLFLVLNGLGGCVALASAPTPEQNTGVLTARMLTALNALVGPGPSSFSWSPNGAALAYVEPRNRQDV